LAEPAPEPPTRPTDPGPSAPTPGSSAALAPVRPVAPAAAPPLAPLGRRLRQKVARGGTEIDARLDLHGLTQDRAHAHLLGFLRGAQQRELKLVLIITGKGARSGGDPERGVLKRVVPRWLALPDFRPYVIGYEPAHAGHGGEGALYVRVRRSR
jgi:DNA-nicking Smr family endonuclease